MRYSEIISETRVRSSPERLALLPIMYGDTELETAKVQAARLKNQRLRIEIARLESELLDSPGDSLARAKVAKLRAETAALRGRR
ncbi:hypothetical protein [Sphingobium yanoikuyae]|uniref:hypothetical protein n=1 Tax=Sphingobium yanoikuyae TaxID=13690 RepID=UPI0035C7695F